MRGPSNIKLQKLGAGGIANGHGRLPASDLEVSKVSLDHAEEPGIDFMSYAAFLSRDKISTANIMPQYVRTNGADLSQACGSAADKQGNCLDPLQVLR